MSIFDSIQRQVTAGAAQQVSKRLGVDPAIAQQAINVAVPAITAALAAHARSGGADAIHQQATKQAAADAPSTAQSSQVLGDQHAAIAQQVSDATGVSREDAGKILNTVAPAVLRGIGEHVQEHGIDSAQLTNALAAATVGNAQAPPASGDSTNAGAT